MLHRTDEKRYVFSLAATPSTSQVTDYYSSNNPPLPHPQGAHHRQGAAIFGQQPRMVHVHRHGTPLHACPPTYYGASLFACLCCFWPAALIALYYSSEVVSRYNAGDYEGAKAASSTTCCCCGLSIIVGLVILGGGIGVMIAFLGGAFNHNYY